MERTTDKRLAYLLGCIADATGKRTGDAWVKGEDGTLKSIPGTIFIERNNPGDYTRYSVVEIDNEQGGESHPFGNRCYRRGELDEVLTFAVNVLEHVKK